MGIDWQGATLQVTLTYTETAMHWECLHSGDSDYRDYALTLPDVHGKGGVLRLTFDLGDNTAYMHIRLDDVDGTEYADGDALQSVPLEWAYAISRGVDGWAG